MYRWKVIFNHLNLMLSLYTVYTGNKSFMHNLVGHIFISSIAISSWILGYLDFSVYDIYEELKVELIKFYLEQNKYKTTIIIIYKDLYPVLYTRFCLIYSRCAKTIISNTTFLMFFSFCGIEFLLQVYLWILGLLQAFFGLA